MATIRVIHRPGADLSPAYAAAEAAGATLAPSTISPEGGLAGAREGDVVLVVPRDGTRVGDAYQIAAAAALERGVRVIEVTAETHAADPDHPGPINAEAAVAGFGDEGFAIAIDLVAGGGE